MKIGFLVNDVDELRPTQTTAMLIQRAAKAGHEAFIVPVDTLEICPDNAIRARTRPVSSHPTPSAMLDEVRHVTPTPLDLSGLDALMIRTNPARDERGWAHEVALEVACLLEERGVFVANRPRSLMRSTTKLMLSRFPSHVVPTTLVTRSLAEIEAFIREAPGEAVLKPLSGTRGQDVFRINPRNAPNLRQIFDVIARRGYCVAQHFVPEAEQGDIRFVLLDGQPLVAGDAVAAVRRVPGPGDFRSNIAVGGRPQAVDISDTMREVAAIIGPQLQSEGLWLAGLDLIGSKVVEINVFSTGGLLHSEQLYGAPFIDVILDWIAARATSPARAA